MDKGGLSIDAETVICLSIFDSREYGRRDHDGLLICCGLQPEGGGSRARTLGGPIHCFMGPNEPPPPPPPRVIHPRRREGGALAILRYRCCFSNSFVSSAALLPGRAGPELGIGAEQTDSHLD